MGRSGDGKRNILWGWPKGFYEMQVNYFHPVTFGLAVLLFTAKFYRVKVSLFQQNLTFHHLYLLKAKSRKIIPKVAR